MACPNRRALNGIILFSSLIFTRKRGAGRLNYSTKFLTASVGIKGRSPASHPTQEFLWGINEIQVSCQEGLLIPMCRTDGSLLIFSVHITFYISSLVFLL